MPMNVALLVVVMGSVAGLEAHHLGTPGAAQGRQRVSPHESVSTTVDGAEVTIVYGRPSMRGRTIFGALVQYGRVWCPGADEATTLDSNKALMLGGLRVPPGPHTIWMLPMADKWTLIVSKNPSGFHTFYDAESDLGRLELKKQELATPVEQLTFAISRAPQGGGMVSMTWERTEVSVPFSVVQ